MNRSWAKAPEAIPRPVSAADGLSPPARRPRLGPRLRAWLPSLALIVLFLLAWEIAVRVAEVPKWLLPAPGAIVTSLATDWPLLREHALVTAQEVVVGLLASIAAGMGLALAMFFSRTIERAVYPLIVASQTIPVPAIAPVLLIWFGYDLLPKVVVVTLICFFPVVVNWWDGLREVDPNLVKLSRSLGGSSWQIFWKLRLPASLPFLFSGLKIAAAVSVIGAIIGEWVGSSAGLGYLMKYAAAQFQTARVFAAIVILSAQALLLFGAVAALERYFLRWQRAGQSLAARRPR